MSETLVNVAVSDETRDRRRGARADQGIYRDFLLAATYFAERARADEARLGGSADVSAADFVRHRAYVTGAILAAAAFLEASINELYMELHGARARDLRLPKRVLPLLGRAWAAIRRTRVLARYQVVLKVADAERFDERRPPFRDADTLMKLRDALVHSRPERPGSARRYRMLEKRLSGCFAANPLAPADSPWFPHLGLSADCAEWAIKAADVFTEEFCRRVALPSRGLSGSEGRAAARLRSDSVRNGEGTRAERPNDASIPGTGS